MLPETFWTVIVRMPDGDVWGACRFATQSAARREGRALAHEGFDVVRVVRWALNHTALRTYRDHSERMNTLNRGRS
ncbi:hypothetical protein [Sciscionella sediminilitoris]|uniref:hypothetical protein n=1 Tax=Sciscionella sediminilitoris TaxID=1445613 RepID=UPI0012E2D493|nr:hypothetical protein [Sciscionella sp. SE31]